MGDVYRHSVFGGSLESIFCVVGRNGFQYANFKVKQTDAINT